jgi:O-antigen ligase
MRHMPSNIGKVFFVLSAATVLVVGLLCLRPEYFSNTSGLAMLIGAETLFAAACNFRRAYFPLILICFLLAGSKTPFRFELLQGRWVVLAVGAVLGLAVFIKTHRQKFATLHLVALFCVLSGFVSAFVSAYPSESLLKVLSLFLLFLYGCAGARTAVGSDPVLFFRGLLRGSEVLLLATACCYLVFRWEVFGNPNSLGAVMAILVMPLLCWGYLAGRSRPERLRLGAELLCALILLLSSFARASIAAAFVSCLLICWSAKEFRLMIKGTALAVVLAIFVVLFVPHHTDAPTWDRKESISSLFIYKGKQHGDVLQSRRTVWQKTWQVIREKPWFGSGFGTSQIDGDMTKLEYAQHHIDTWVVREHGNSYLAIIEWTGLLGVVPFLALVALVARNAGRTFRFVRRNCDLSSPALPAAAIAISGLVHATFEDWLFAVGYYVCVFFWCTVFILADVMPSAVARYSPSRAVPDPVSSYGAVASLQ